MSIIHVRRIKAMLQELYQDEIDVSDIKNLEQKESGLLTRSQAAYVISHLADISHAEAAKAVTDGYDDNGIDAAYYDRSTKNFYLVQSKWVENGNKSPDLGGVVKFINGVKDLLHANFNKFNEKFEAKRPEILEALDSIKVRFVLVIVYTGTQPLSNHAKEALQEFVDIQNDSYEFMSLKIYDQQMLMKAISGAVLGDPINVEVVLYDWGEMNSPYYAVYGQVDATDIAQWYLEYDTKLLAKNLRTFQGETDVNIAIKTTLTSDAHNFWYFNNGITVLCNSIEKTARGGNNRNIGIFVCKNVSVVNGAQTVGSIAETYRQGFGNVDRARVLVRFISLEKCPAGFGARVTTATNTQNPVFNRDFAALDSTQERLKSDLWYDLKKSYLYRGEKNVYPDKGCTIEEAAIALACAYGDVVLAVHAKREVSKLFEDIQKEPYLLLFNSDLPAARLWNTVQVLRAVESHLVQEKQNLTGTKRLVAVHGNRFILYRVFQTIALDELDSLDLNPEEVTDFVVEKANFYLDLVTRVIDKEFSGVYLTGLFKSGAQCKKLDAALPEDPDVKPRPRLQQRIQRSLFDLL